MKKSKDGFVLYQNRNGCDVAASGCRMIEQDGFWFKDLAKTGMLLPYEDWRLPAKDRAKDLAERLSMEEVAGLMLYSSHQMVPFYPGVPFQDVYGGKPFDEGTTEKWALSDGQKKFLVQDHVRNVLLLTVADVETAVRWNNAMQKLAEEQPWGIPVNISSDPRHGVTDSAAEYKSGGLPVSKWPEGIGMAVAGEKHWKNYARAVKAEYRALGITTALGPQIDLATEPRWMRYEDTFGGNLETSIRMTQVICGEMQSTPESEDGWGSESVVAMAKHWPGGGTGEGGRDAHYGFGKYAVYPGENFENHRRVFTDGAFRLEGKTGKVGAVMPYYTVSWNRDTKNGENVGNSYSEYLIHDLLREQYGYDGVVCTDWGITGNPSEDINDFSQRCYGVEQLSVAERHLRILMNGVDHFGGNNDAAPVLEAYRIGCERYGEETMTARMREAAVRLLTNMFRCGLFEIPYLELEKSEATVGSPEFAESGRQAQRDSVVLLKNRGGCLPLKKGIRVYVPERNIRGGRNFFRMMEDGRRVTPLSQRDCEGYCQLVSSPEEADAAIVLIESPLTDPYHPEDRDAGGNGYFPISLQYRPYTAEKARAVSLAGGDFREPSDNRSYRGKTNTARNEADLDLVLNTRKAMGDKPVIVCLRMHNPCIVGEFERETDALLAEFGVEKQVLLDLIFGNASPKGTLPAVMPKNMDTVEQHCEDVFDDIAPYQDELGNQYEPGFGLDYGG